MNKLIIQRMTWIRIKDTLLRDGAEHLCFILTEHIKLKEANLFLERELQLIEDKELEGEENWCGLSLKLESLLHVMNRANELRCVLIEAHSHPFSKDTVSFSHIDLQGQKEMVAYLSDVNPGKPYGALVLGENSVQGQMWFPNSKKTPSSLDEIKVIGPTLSKISASGKTDKIVFGRHIESDNPFHRQILALGQDGQKKIQQTQIAIVGAGGIGSIVAQELIYLGVQNLTLIDDDVLEKTNLNRVIGATPKDIGKPKVAVALKYLKRINPKARISILNANVRSINALDVLKETDVIFGCVDTDSGRLILNELANAYYVPYIDCGVGIETRDERIVEAGGRVIVWIPGRACLLCAKEINARIAAEELESPEERQFRQKHGYVAGSDIPEPAVISLNGTIASLAATEFLAFVTGFRESRHYTFYDMLEQRIVPRIVKKDDKCLACNISGRGDRADINRYSRTGLPTDLPRTSFSRISK